MKTMKKREYTAPAMTEYRLQTEGAMLVTSVLPEQATVTELEVLTTEEEYGGFFQ